MAIVTTPYTRFRTIDFDDLTAEMRFKNCGEKIPRTQRYMFVKRGVFKSAAARQGART
jgi:hypothetical protein